LIDSCCGWVAGLGALGRWFVFTVPPLAVSLNLNSKIVPLSNDGIKYMPINPSYDKKLETIFPSISIS
jgi:hypothetical protein